MAQDCSDAGLYGHMHDIAVASAFFFFFGKYSRFTEHTFLLAVFCVDILFRLGVSR